MTRYVTTRDNRLDDLVDRLMGTAEDGAVEAVLVANPGLASLGPVIPLGTLIVVPDLPAKSNAGYVRAWE